MEKRVSTIATHVIESADAAHPADARLRSVLRTQGGLSRLQSRAIARGVFAYYRWFGWLDRTASLAKQLEQAAKLARQFAAQPESISNAELAAKAIPAWIKDFMDTPVAWLRMLQAEPSVWLRARPGQAHELMAKLGDCHLAEQTSVTSALCYHGTLDLFRQHEFQAGEFEVQDIASQAVGWLCAPKPGETWWDACAGEGGKTLHLSDLMQNKGLIWATDRAAWRLNRLKLRAARARVFNYRAALWVCPGSLPTRTRFDGVLVDAPCSGVGTWQRNPQAKWTSSAQDLEELAVAQLNLLQHVADGVKPGGKLIYSVCTLTRRETDDVVQAFEKRAPDFRPLPVHNPFELNATETPYQWWWPQQTRGNGMFVVVWQRMGFGTRNTCMLA